MLSKYSLSVSLTEHLCCFVEAQIASGRFRSASEVMRAGLRLLERDVADVVPPARGSKSGAVVGDGADGSAPPRNMP
jgi:antitoxin ParD1/3/4